MQEYNQPTSSPTQKVAAAGIGGAITVVLVYAINMLFNIEVPAEVAAALTAIVSFLSGYFVREKR